MDSIYEKRLKEEQLNPYDILNFSIDIILVIRKMTRQFTNNNDYAMIFKSMLKLKTIDQIKKYVKSFAFHNSAEYEKKCV